MTYEADTVKITHLYYDVFIETWKR